MSQAQLRMSFVPAPKILTDQFTSHCRSGNRDDPVTETNQQRFLVERIRNHGIETCEKLVNGFVHHRGIDPDREDFRECEVIRTVLRMARRLPSIVRWEFLIPTDYGSSSFNVRGVGCGGSGQDDSSRREDTCVWTCGESRECDRVRDGRRNRAAVHRYRLSHHLRSSLDFAVSGSPSRKRPLVVLGC